jgi:hypothetical protein
MEISIREYARQSGVSHVKILKDIKAGRIPKTASGKIDKDLADAAWAQNRTISRESKRDHAASAAPRAKEEGRRSYADAREKREYIHLERDAVGLKKLRGSLISVEEVDARARTIANAVREGMLAIPDRVSSLFAAETDPRRIHLLLSAEIRKVLIALADGIQ